MAQEPSPAPTEPAKPATATATATVSTTTTTPAATKDDGATDHSKVVGHVGVGYFGVTAQPIGTGTPSTAARGTVQVPVIGARYWFSEKMGIDAGVGLNFFSSGTSAESGSTTISADGPAVMAFAVHGGVPIAFATGKHYKFLVVPELNFGYATQSETAQNPPAGTVKPGDFHRSGIRFDAGARVGTEIQFGFIGIPELALQASVGLNLRDRIWSVSQDASPPTTPAATAVHQHQLDFGTTVQADPWAIFAGNIAAIYYLP